MKEKPPRIWLVLAFRCQEKRQKFHISQEDMAHKLQVHRVLYSKWEAAKAAPNLVNLAKMAKALGIEPGELLRDPGTPLSVEPIFRMPRGHVSQKPKTSKKKALLKG